MDGIQTCQELWSIRIYNRKYLSEEFRTLGRYAGDDLKGFGITMSQFFAEGEMVELTPELKELFDNWVNLTPEQKIAANQMLRAMNKQ